MTATADVAGLLEYATTRLQDRMAGLTDHEWEWQPVAGDARVTIRWRLDHLAETLGDDRNREWLGEEPTGAPPIAPAASADAAVAAVVDAGTRFTALVRGLDAEGAAPIGPVAGPYADDSRLSFVLHVVDELVHHAAEAALLRDLYAERTAAPDGSAA